MKSSAALFLSSCVLALASDTATLHPLNPRSACYKQSSEVSHYVKGPFTGTAQLKWAISGDALAHSVCAQLRPGSDHPCTAYAPTVAVVVGGIIQLQTIKNAPKSGALSSGRNGRRGAEADPAGILTDHIVSRGFVWDQIESPEIQRRGDVVVEEHFVIRGVSHPDLQIAPADVYYTSYADGTGSIRTVHPPAVGSAHAGLARRADAPGFKYSWRTDSSGVIADDAVTNPDISAVAVRVGEDISKNWAYDSDYYGLDQWIGTAAISYILQGIVGTSIRIIPETRSFGVEYEDVGVCGGL